MHTFDLIVAGSILQIWILIVIGVKQGLFDFCGGCLINLTL